MSASVGGRVAWGSLAATSVLVTGVVILVIVRGAEPVPGFEGAGFQPLFVATALALGFSFAGALIVARRRSQPIGWLFCVAGLTAAITGFTREYAERALVIDPGSLPAGEPMAWLGSWMWIGMIPLLGTVGLLLFPTGRPPSPRWRPVLWASIAMLVLLALGFGFAQEELESPAIDNPVGLLPEGWFEPVGVLLLLTIVACMASVVVRYRGARGDERQQLRWIAAAVSLYILLLLVALIVEAAGGDVEWLQDVGTLALVAAAAVAILKYRLYDLDLVVNRALVYGALTALVVAGYIGIVTGLGELLDSSGLGIALAGTAVVAVAIQPLRSLVQRRVDRLMYGDRDDPHRALSRLGERLGEALDPDAVLPAIVETVADGLRLPYVAIELQAAGGHRVAAGRGEPREAEPVRLPLTYHGEEVGRLLASPRAGEGELRPADLALLAELARQAGVAVHAVRLTADLRRSRETLVSAREEERRRLRRDLHDGLGPALAGIALEIESARSLVERDPAAARELLARLRGEVQESIADIRRISHDLRPPTLDELGLVAAVREQAERLGVAAGPGAGASANGLRVAVESPPALPPLPAAVEVAAYRIALEAMTNVSRHAGASSCAVRIAVSGALELEIADDGSGIDGRGRAGVGLVSMRERAEELGGSASIGPGAGGRGTVVRIQLPVERR